MGGEGMNILLVDDDLFNQDLACMLLEDDGHQVTVADNGQKALDELARHDFEVVFLDMEMPVLNGIETAKIIRSCEAGKPLAEYDITFPATSLVDRYRGKRLLLLAMTGNNDEGSRTRCREAGIDEFLAKPYALKDFRKILQYARQEVMQEGKDSADSISDNEAAKREDLVETVFNHMKNAYPLEDDQLHRLLQESIKSVQQALEEIEQGVENRNLVVVAAASHRVKGTLLGMGLDAQMELARTLESSAKAEEQQESEELAKELGCSLSRLFGKRTS